MTIFAYLPLEVIEIILSYDGVYKKRNGHYMKQICHNDTRYKLLDTIPKPRKSIPGIYFCHIYIDFFKQHPYRTLRILIIYVDTKSEILYYYDKLLDGSFEYITL